MQYTREQIENAVKAKGYLWFNSNTNYDVNIVGIRNSAPGKKVSNIFDDLITISYKVNGEWFFHAWPATTASITAPNIIPNIKQMTKISIKSIKTLLEPSCTSITVTPCISIIITPSLNKHRTKSL
jgi:hypothetical protein